jgi:hypothetical protein
MIYRTTRFSLSAAKPKKHICYGRPAAVYFSNEKELIRWLAIAFLLSWTLLSVDVVSSGFKSALSGSPSSFERQRVESLVEEYEVQAPKPGVESFSLPPGLTNLVTEQAEEEVASVAQGLEHKLWPDLCPFNECLFHDDPYGNYDGLGAFVGDDIISNFFANIAMLFWMWFRDSWLIVGPLPPLVALLVVNSYRSSYGFPRWPVGKIGVKRITLKTATALYSSRQRWCRWRTDSR